VAAPPIRSAAPSSSPMAFSVVSSSPRQRTRPLYLIEFWYLFMAFFFLSRLFFPLFVFGEDFPDAPLSVLALGPHFFQFSIDETVSIVLRLFDSALDLCLNRFVFLPIAARRGFKCPHASLHRPFPPPHLVFNLSAPHLISPHIFPFPLLFFVVSAC